MEPKPSPQTADQLKTIVLSHHIFGLQGFGGISRYFEELVQPLRQRDTRVVCDGCWTLNSEGNPLGLKPVPSILNRRGLGWRTATYLNDASSRRRTRELGFAKDAIYHRTYYSSTSNRLELPEVLTVYDMIHEDFPEYFTRPIFPEKVASLRKARHIICISHSTKDRLLHYLPDLESRVSVVHLGLTTGSVHEESDSRLILQGPPTVAYIGGRSGYKNFAVLLQAIAISVGKGEPLRLKVIGQPLSKSEQKTMTQLGIGQLVVEVVNPPSIDEALEDCFAVVSTSLAEGFGLVSLEAGKRRIPLVSSDIPVMREILGDAALYFPPKDPLRLHEMLLRLLESTDEYFERAAAMFRATERYSVEKMATETMTVYHQVAQEEAGRRRAR